MIGTERFAGHPGLVRALALSPDRTTLATGGDDGTVRLWDVRERQETRRVTAHPGGVRSLAWHAGGLVSGGADVAFWDPDLVAPTRVPVAADALVRFPDGRVFAASATGLHEVRRDRVRTLHRGARGVTAVGAVGGGVFFGDGSGGVWRPGDAGEQVVVRHRGPVTALAADAGGALLVTGGADGVLRAWDEALDSVLATLRVDAAVVALAVFDGQVRAVGADGRGWRWDVARNTVAFVEFGRAVSAALPSAAGVYLGCLDRTVRFRDWGGGVGAVFAGHDGGVRALAVVPGRLISAGGDRAVRSWALDSGAPGPVLLGPEASVRAVAPVGDAVLACAMDGTVWGWDPDGAATPLSAPDRPTEIRSGAVSATGTVVTARVDDTLHAHSAHAGPFAGAAEHARVRAIAVGGDELAASCGLGGRLVLWRRSTPAGFEFPRFTDVDLYAVALTPRGEVAVGGDDGSVWVHPPTGAPRVLTGGSTARVEALVLDGTGRVAAGSTDGAVRVWPAGAEAPTVLAGHVGQVRALCFLPDGRLASGGFDGTVRIWDAARGVQVDGTGVPAVEPGRARSGVVNDEPAEVDRLGFGTDVDTLAALIADRATRPPLSVALLGRWGSGKSTFLRRLDAAVAALAAGSGADGHYTASVRQVHFNAWQYSDDHLWVGLVEHLFGQLAVPADPATEAERATARAAVQELRARSEALGAELARDDGLAAGLRSASVLRLLWRERTVLRRRAASVAAVLVLVPAVLVGVAAVAFRGSALVAVWAAVAAAAAAGLAVLDGLRSGLARFRGLGTTLREKVRSRKEDVDRQLAEAEGALSRVDPAEQLSALVREVRTGHYDRHRGVLGEAHRHLDTLSRAGGSGRGAPERIVLYVDDLDRCAPERVVDVLAAVHLLLALPLFVVVVAVDPRRLRAALELHAERFGTADGGPLEYLDKIFQITFALRPMGAAADELIDELLATPNPEPEPAGPASAPRPAAPTRDAPPPSPAPPAPLPVSAPRAAPGPAQPWLGLRDAERTTVKLLRPLLTTPRAVKRLVNLYRLVRTGIAPADLDRFLAGPYRAVLVLLTVSVARPDRARELLGTLVAGPDDRPVADVLAELAERHRWWDDVRALVAAVDAGQTTGVYRRWAGTVARFSIETHDLTAAAEHGGDPVITSATMIDPGSG